MGYNYFFNRYSPAYYKFYDMELLEKWHTREFPFDVKEKASFTYEEMCKMFETEPIHIDFKHKNDDINYGKIQRRGKQIETFRLMCKGLITIYHDEIDSFTFLYYPKFDLSKYKGNGKGIIDIFPEDQERSFGYVHSDRICEFNETLVTFVMPEPYLPTKSVSKRFSSINCIKLNFIKPEEVDFNIPQRELTAPTKFTYEELCIFFNDKPVKTSVQKKKQLNKFKKVYLDIKEKETKNGIVYTIHPHCPQTTLIKIKKKLNLPEDKTLWESNYFIDYETTLKNLERKRILKAQKQD